MNPLERAYRLSKARIAMREDIRRTAFHVRHAVLPEPAADIPDYAEPLLIAAQAKCWLAQVKEVSRVRH